MDILEKLKVLLGIYDSDNDILLSEIINISREKILLYINKKELPSQLNWILIELAIKRFNKIGSEGISSESIDGKSNSYEADYILEFKDYLDNYIYQNSNSDENTKWRLF